jgi:hypothetical protein
MEDGSEKNEGEINPNWNTDKKNCNYPAAFFLKKKRLNLKKSVPLK